MGRRHKVAWAGLQTALQLIYPPRCLTCGGMVESDFGLCGPCWRDTPFIGGLVCDLCGTPLPGVDDGVPVHCDSCMTTERPWQQGRAALMYRDSGRRLVLSLKHGDRHDVVRPAAKWMAHSARPLLREDTLIAPIPLHWSRMARRRFNQSALLADALARETGRTSCPDLLIRANRTRSLEGLTRNERFATLMGSIRAHPKRTALMEGRSILLVDDVMTSGATLAAATEACYASRAREVCVIALTRVANES
ncbi:ComF family protein [Primorskyibacter sedentarius]|uniref:ComF family protein n=1 Tax=Primorskyibacter sedentarius TaxID=745311 RepID=UPI001043F37E|nr:ComF family protein [Primorskyibacter sedentarius]